MNHDRNFEPVEWSCLLQCLTSVPVSFYKEAHMHGCSQNCPAIRKQNYSILSSLHIVNTMSTYHVSQIFSVCWRTFSISMPIVWHWLWDLMHSSHAQSFWLPPEICPSAVHCKIQIKSHGSMILNMILPPDMLQWWCLIHVLSCFVHVLLCMSLQYWRLVNK